MPSPGQLIGGYLPQRIVDFFAENPDEELTMNDAMVKFDCTSRQLHETLIRLRSVGVIETPKLIRRAR